MSIFSEISESVSLVASNLLEDFQIFSMTSSEDLSKKIIEEFAKYVLSQVKAYSPSAREQFSVTLKVKLKEYQPSGEGGARSPPATPAKSKLPPGAPKCPMGSGKASTPRFLGFLNNFR